MNSINITATTLKEIEEAVKHIAGKLRADATSLSTFGRSVDFARPHIEVDNKGFHFVIIERGVEQERRTTQKPKELFYWIFDSIVTDMALSFELENRREHQDSRKLYFEKCIELLGELDEEWKKRKEKEIECILHKHPYSHLTP